MHHRIGPLVTLSFMLAACQPGTVDLTEAQRSAIAAEVDSITSEWWAAWEAVDVERGVSFLYEGPGFVWAGAGPTLYSAADAREVWPSMVAGLGRQDLEFMNARTVVLAADVVWTLREMNWAAVDTAGAVVAEGQSIETAVWVKRDGEWKVMLGHDNDATRPM